MFLLIDIGTSYLKTALLSNDLSFLCFNAEKIDPTNYNTWINAIKNSITIFKNDFKHKLTNINMIAVCGNGPTLIPYSSKHTFTSFSWIKNSNRSFIQTALHIKNNYPEIYNSTEYFLSCPELITFLLTDIAITCAPPSELEFMYWDTNTLLKEGLNTSLFPNFIKYGTFLGKTTNKAEKIFNIPSNIPVLSPCIDFMADLIGTNSFYNLNICNRIGTAETVNIISDTKISKPDVLNSFLSYKHPFSDTLYNISFKIPYKAQLKRLEFLKDTLNLNEFKCLNLNKHKRFITTCGYMANDSSYNQTKADYLKMPVIKPKVVQTGILGMGILAKSYLERIDLKKLANEIFEKDKIFSPSSADFF